MQEDATFVRDGAPEDLPVPRPNMRCTGRHVFSGFGFAEPLRKTVEMSVGAPTVWEVGRSRYAALPTTLVTISPDGTYAEVVMYVPELGTGVLIEYRDGTVGEVFGYVAVRTN